MIRLGINHFRASGARAGINYINRSAQWNHYTTQEAPSIHARRSLKSEIVPIFRRAADFTNRVAVRDDFANYTYGNLIMGAKYLSDEININLGTKNSERVLFLCSNDVNYVLTQWAIWVSGQIGVPMSAHHPQSMLEYFARDSKAKLIVCTKDHAELMDSVASSTNIKLLVVDENIRNACASKQPERAIDFDIGLSSDFYNRSNAMILYTSGTTGKPKGVVLSHKNLIAQMNSLITAWQWKDTDAILHCLPLHHVHGVVNALMCPLYTGAKCVMLRKFDSTAVWTDLLGINAKSNDRKVNIFMAVPTIYAKLIEEYNKVFAADAKMCEHIRNTLKSKLRLMVSGSAPLPAPIFDKWLEISGHTLLERYGMTETGMCLSNPFDGPRLAGYVGNPLPSVSVRLVDTESTVLVESSNVDGKETTVCCTAEPQPQGELYVHGETVFKEYFGRQETDMSKSGWFNTGDVAMYDKDKNAFKMLGRTSVDIIKTGGYKVSALDIETHLLAHPNIIECAVLGVPDEVWGERVAAVIVTKDSKELLLDSLRIWSKDRIADYAVPTRLHIVDSIERNAMGKVNKKHLLQRLKDDHLIQ